MHQVNLDLTRIKKIAVDGETPHEIRGEQLIGVMTSFIVSGDPVITVVYVGDRNVPQVESYGIGLVRIFQ